MTTLREAAEMALEALEEINKLSIGEHAICLPAEIDGAMDALRERLAQPEQEPVPGVVMRYSFPTLLPDRDIEHTDVRLYTSPPPPRQPLTDDEIDKVTDAQWARNNHKPIYAAHRAYARAIERAHGIGGEE